MGPSAVWSAPAARLRDTGTMERYRILYEGRGRVSGRDAYHVTVAVWRDRDYLGLFSTWVSGIELATAGPSSLGITRDLYWRFIADELCREIERAARGGDLRREWSDEVVTLGVDLAEVSTRAHRMGAPAALREEAELHAFEI